MTLKEKQWLFMELLPKLINKMLEEGFHPVIGYAYRDQETQNRLFDQGKSATKTSNHQRCLAIDIELFDSDGDYRTDKEAHEQFGEYWKSLHSDCGWGGDFGWDANHYSIRHNGVT